MARAAAHFTSGDLTLEHIVARLGGNPVYTRSGDAGVPTDGRSGPFFNPTWLPAGRRPSQLASPTSASGDGGASGVCVYPEVLPLETVFPIPAAGMSGLPLSGPGSGVVWGGIGLLAFALWAINEQRPKGRVR